MQRHDSPQSDTISLLPPTPSVSARPAVHEGLFAHRFKACHRRSLDNYQFFYDDVDEVGRADDATHVFYFVPGLNGTPGQMRFMLPSLTRVFGSRIFLKALHLPEFSARRPTWEKYTAVNLDRKLAHLRDDLTGLLARHARIAVLCSSNGYYDFAAAASRLPRAALAGRVQLVWGACAPDSIESASWWENVFFPLNGFTHDGHRWFAYPNHNALTRVNPETSTTRHWRDGHQRRRFVKMDLESRFRCWGLDWDYVSPSQFSAAVRHVVRQIQRPWEFPAEALIAANDGYWHGRSRREVEQTIRRHLPQARLMFKPDSHLWVVNPTNLTEVFERLKPHLPPLH